MNEFFIRQAAKMALMAGGIDSPAESEIKILTKIMVVFIKQQLKGHEKYPTAVDPLDHYDWMEMKLEEQIDGSVYGICELIKTQHHRDQYDATMKELKALVEAGEITLDQIKEGLKK